MNTMKCIDCLVMRAARGERVDDTLDFATLAITMLDGNAVCTGHLARRLTEGANYEQELDRQKRQIIDHYRD